ncbi:MFS transporter [Angustibacter luteus]|uniref:MFS transporter n=1 Tax=Angustibacter luteus TaxID=658456 RepID=A0ABW1JIT0_9ACTN
MPAGSGPSTARVVPRRALVVVCAASAVEWYDYAVYGALASVLVGVVLPSGAAREGLVPVFAVFATSFLTRPLGAILVGLRADRSGRRQALATMVLLMTAATAAIGLLPPWSAIGLLAPVLLLLLRMVQGFSSGGGISSSIPFVAESAPRTRWGLYGGWHTSTVAGGIASGIAVAGIVSAVLSADDLQRWGWRIPFLLAVPLGLVGWSGWRRLGETAEFRALGPGRPAPSLGRVWREHGRAVRTGFALIGVLAATFNVWFVFLPAHLVAEDVHRLPVALGCAGAGLVVAALSAPLLGLLSDRVGRRPLLATGTVGLGVLVLPLYGLASSGSTSGLLVADVVVGALLGSLVVSAYLAERFPVELRATGVAMTYGLATALVGGTAPLIGSVLANRGWPAGGAIYLAAWCAAGVVATVRAPIALSSPGRLAERAPC